MKTLLALLLVCIASQSIAQNNQCNLKIQVLGSGGPELTENRASSSYLVWLNDKAVLLIDAGGGSSLRYGQSKANWQNLKVVLFSHFHADHSSDFAAMIKASWFGYRQDDLPVFGPFGNSFMPSTNEFVASLVGEKNGTFKYLSDFYDNKTEVANYRLQPRVIEDKTQTQDIYQDEEVNISAQVVKHGPIPAVAYIVKACDKTLVFSGDTNTQGFENLILNKTDVLIAHNAIPDNAGKSAKSLHMTPSQIGVLANALNTDKLILSHRMKRTIGKEQQTLKSIKDNFKGNISFANDLDVY